MSGAWPAEFAYAAMQSANRVLASTLRAQGQPLDYRTGPGGHSFHTFWTQAPAAFRFYAAALAAC